MNARARNRRCPHLASRSPRAGTAGERDGRRRPPDSRARITAHRDPLPTPLGRQRTLRHGATTRSPARHQRTESNSWRHVDGSRRGEAASQRIRCGVILAGCRGAAATVSLGGVPARDSVARGVGHRRYERVPFMWTAMCGPREATGVRRRDAGAGGGVRSRGPRRAAGGAGGEDPSRARRAERIASALPAARLRLSDAAVRDHHDGTGRVDLYRSRSVSRSRGAVVCQVPRGSPTNVAVQAARLARARGRDEGRRRRVRAVRARHLERFG